MCIRDRQWVREFDSKKGEIIAGLKRVMGALFTRDNMTVSYTADDQGFSFLPEACLLYTSRCV